jgi:hypothetical protein
MSKDHSLKDKIQSVYEFHAALGIDSNEAPEHNIGEKDYLLRNRLMHEENEEEQVGN